ncbi:MAG: hypothetical protein IKU69_04975 [Roseburia sp.]|nr:hypothetical protein [Roseburia sp.]
MEIAEKVSSNHHFRHLMIPINVQSRDAAEKKNQMFKGEKCSILECAKGCGLEVHASGSLGQGYERIDNKNFVISKFLFETKFYKIIVDLIVYCNDITVLERRG